MLKALYKKILKKLGLTREELLLLKEKLSPENICKGPFIKDNKMCPNTTALAIKTNRKFANSLEILEIFKKYKISRHELWLFYLQFDIPSKISERFFKHSLENMKEGINELIQVP